MKKMTSEQWWSIYGKRREEDEAARKASLSAECRIAKDDDPRWTKWEWQGTKWSRRNIAPEENTAF